MTLSTNPRAPVPFRVSGPVRHVMTLEGERCASGVPVQ